MGRVALLPDRQTRVFTRQAGLAAFTQPASPPLSLTHFKLALSPLIYTSCSFQLGKNLHMKRADKFTEYRSPAFGNFSKYY